MSVVPITPHGTPPFRAVIELDLWVWGRERAAAVLEQLIAELAKQNTDDQGAILIRHRITTITLRDTRL